MTMGQMVTASLTNWRGYRIRRSSSRQARTVSRCWRSAGTVFETPLGLDDEFALSGGHSIAIARLAQKLHAAGWPIGVRALLSDRNTARKVANHVREMEAETATPRIVIPEQNASVRDEAAAEVLSVRKFTTLQILFSLFQYSPRLSPWSWSSAKRTTVSRL